MANPKPEDLQKEIERLKGEVETLNKTIAEKDAQAEQNKSDLEAQVETLTAKTTNLETELAGAKSELETTKEELALTVDVNNELAGKFEAVSKAMPADAAPVSEGNKLSTDTFAVGDSKYTFSYKKMHHKGNTITAAEVLASEELQAELVGMGSGMIKKVD